jgi:hypothetical protein
MKNFDITSLAALADPLRSGIHFTELRYNYEALCIEFSEPEKKNHKGYPKQIRQIAKVYFHYLV